MKKLFLAVLFVLLCGAGAIRVGADGLPFGKSQWQIGAAPMPTPTPVATPQARHKKKKWGMNGHGWTRPVPFGFATPTLTLSPTPTMVFEDRKTKFN